MTGLKFSLKSSPYNYCCKPNLNQKKKNEFNEKNINMLYNMLHNSSNAPKKEFLLLRGIDTYFQYFL